MGKRKFIYITPFIEEDFFTGVKLGIADAAEMLQVDVLFTGTPDADCKALSGLIDKAACEKYDGIAVSLVDEEALTPAVNRAAEAGIPIVAFNIGRTKEAKVLSSVCQDAYRAGCEAGRRLKPGLKEEGKILFTLHDDVEVLRLRLDGMQSVIGECSMTVMVSGNTPELAKKAIIAELERDQTICAVIGTGQSDTHGAGLAAKELKGKRDFYVAGFDECPDILDMVKDETIDFTIDQQPYVQGFYPLVQLFQNAVHKIMPSDINAGNVVIDKTRMISG
ncbi:substrate-binding domain-containing protein [Robinsoniella peoriensis]|uniref:substrate-binding domain-containing protein n=1 Tax=Robinsoniella peoriensis TaxID=180332 RepID=UPI0005C7D586|nr:substrate-binding domain-containing protein [Robinsoniella peoriensis]